MSKIAVLELEGKKYEFWGKLPLAVEIIHHNEVSLIYLNQRHQTVVLTDLRYVNYNLE